MKQRTVYKFSPTSQKRLETCDPRLQKLMVRAIETAPTGMDFTILCGHRNQADQNKAVAERTSRVSWPGSKHNSLPSRAVDVAPYPIDWKDIQRFKLLGAHILATAAVLGIKIRWGGDFNMDGDKTTKDSWDKPHFELVG